MVRFSSNQEPATVPSRNRHSKHWLYSPTGQDAGRQGCRCSGVFRDMSEGRRTQTSGTKETAHTETHLTPSLLGLVSPGRQLLKTKLHESNWFSSMPSVISSSQNSLTHDWRIKLAVLLHTTGFILKALINYFKTNILHWWEDEWMKFSTT